MTVNVTMWRVGCLMTLLMLTHGARAVEPSLAVRFQQRPGAFVVEVTGNAVIRPDLRTYGKNGSLVVDIPGTPRSGAQRISVRKHGVQWAWMGWYQAKPPITRLRVLLSEPTPKAYRLSADQRVLRIAVGRDSAVLAEQWDLEIARDTAAMASVAPLSKSGAASDTDKPVLNPVEPQSGTAPSSVAPDNTGANADVPTERARPAPMERSPRVQTGSAIREDSPRKVNPAPAVSDEPPGNPGNVVSATSLGSASWIRGNRVSVNLANTELSSVLRALAMQSGMNIVAAPEVKGQITINVNNVTVEEALDLVAHISGFQVQRFGQTWVVGGPETMARLLSSTTPQPGSIMETHSVGAADTTQLEQVIKKMVPAVGISWTQPVEGKGSVAVLMGTPEDVNKAKSLLTQLSAGATIATPAEKVVDTYRVKHAKVSDLVNLCKSLFPSVTVMAGPEAGFNKQAPAAIQISKVGGESTLESGGEETKTAGDAAQVLVLTGEQTEIDRVKTFLSHVDIGSPQVLIEARVLDVNTNWERTLGLGIDFTNAVLNSTFDVANGVFRIGRVVTDATTRTNTSGNSSGSAVKVEVKDGVPTTNSTVDTSSTSSSSTTRNRTDTLMPMGIEGRLKALIDNNDARLLAKPSILVLENRPARIFIGDEVKYVISIQQTPQGANVQTETAQVGIQLNVIARINNNGEITLSIHPEVSTIREWITIAATGLALPNISRRFADSTIRMKSGDTVVIGGLISDQDVKRVSKVPLLGDLPVFGYLFKQDAKQRRNSEVVVFLKATVLSD